MPRIALAVVGHVSPPVEAGDTMSPAHALSALAALGQPTRLEIFRLLIRREPSGLAAGVIAEAIECPQNTLSSHLGILARAGLVRGMREGRSIVYRADIEGMRALMEFLVTDCCHGHPELCNLQNTIRDENSCNAGARKRRKKSRIAGSKL
jgi:ArsR family transcriptional regulator